MSVYNTPMTPTLKVKVEVLAIPTLRLFWHSLRILIQVGSFKVCEKSSSENCLAPTCWTLAKQGYEECGTFKEILKTGCFPYVSSNEDKVVEKDSSGYVILIKMIRLLVNRNHMIFFWCNECLITYSSFVFFSLNEFRWLDFVPIFECILPVFNM